MVTMRRKRRYSPMRLANFTWKLSMGLVKFYNDGVVQAVTFAYLI